MKSPPTIHQINKHLNPIIDIWLLMTCAAILLFKNDLTIFSLDIPRPVGILFGCGFLTLFLLNVYRRMGYFSYLMSLLNQRINYISIMVLVVVLFSISFITITAVAVKGSGDDINFFINFLIVISLLISFGDYRKNYSGIDL